MIYIKKLKFFLYNYIKLIHALKILKGQTSFNPLETPPLIVLFSSLHHMHMPRIIYDFTFKINKLNLNELYYMYDTYLCAKYDVNATPTSIVAV